MPSPKLSTDATDRPYESNPFLLLNHTFEAFGLMAEDFLKLLGLTILSLIVSAIPLIVGLVSIKAHSQSYAAMGLIALSILLALAVSIYAGYAFIRLSLAAARGKKLSWRAALPVKFSHAWNTFWTSALAAIIIIFGFLFFIVPGILFAVFYSQVQYVAVDERIYGLKALVRSHELVRHRLIDMYGILGMNQLIQLVSYFPVVGPFVSLAFALLTMPLMPIRFIQLTQLSAKDRKSLPTNKWNYFLLYGPVVLSLLFLIVYIAITVTGAISHKA